MSPPNPSPGDQEDNEDLMDQLMAELDSKDSTTQTEAATILNKMNVVQAAENGPVAKPANDSKSRYKARQERKAAALAEEAAQNNPDDPTRTAQFEREAAEEEKVVNAICDEMGFTMHEINPDGHCLFSAIADQLGLHGLIPSSQVSYANVRHAAANYIQDHVDDFLPFLPSEFGEDGDGAVDTGLMSPKAFAAYCERIRNTGQWGGEPEILALSRAYNVPIFVVQSGTPRVVVHTPTGATVDWRDKNIKALWISYHRRMYGLGEHYNSLRPKSSVFSKIATALNT
ncbi:OTU-domain-containing protein [Punctularia strigosozonata HHB-11173 SS5]|uniref:OTU-domain-containing protein n=1 Tax=Punctularia strigosozonata (strain HHB-11173) TaxID=741275 RepID=UPI0004417D47|nr:OTU-domain-containing protein [Punctularia strigosozonata HHB-11173 SS5]EIN07395.1 OTU-domain-containing protein [Punctularia strigosozonata HHB-11173 SS5]